jgi:hypothetical protein
MSDACTRPDPAAAYEALRTTATQMLGLDLANELTPTADPAGQSGQRSFA